MRLWTLTAFAAILAGARPTSQVEPGEYRGTLTTSSDRQLAGRATYTRCGNLLHIWLADTILRSISMEFGTSVASLGPRSFQAQPVDLLYPLRSRVPGTRGFFRLYVPPDTLLFADSGTMRFAGLDHGEIAGEFRYAVSEGWAGKPQLVASVVGRFRALRDTLTERAIYRGARCDHPGAEWSLRGEH
jgi:hypothetical protein